MTHAEKFAAFEQFIQDAKEDKFDEVWVAFPSVLGDNYEELIENLSKIADVGVMLGIRGRSNTL